MSLQLERGVVGYWCPMLQTTGLAEYDRSVRKNRGTLTGMDAASDRVIAKVRNTAGRVLDFDGVNDYVALKPDATLYTMPFTVSTWALAKNTTQNMTIFSGGLSTNAIPFFYVVFRGDVAGDPIQVQMRGSNNLNSTFNGSSFVANRFYHVVAVFSSETLRTVYVDGVQGQTDTTLHTATALDRISIGSLVRNTTAVFLNGQVAEVGVWDRSLAASEIREIYRLGPGWFGKRSSRSLGYSEQFAAGFKAYWARRQSQLIGGGL